jgi:hypothetical protein
VLGVIVRKEEEEKEEKAVKVKDLLLRQHIFFFSVLSDWESGVSFPVFMYKVPSVLAK